MLGPSVITMRDSFWQAAAEAALVASREADVVLVPQEFLALSPRFALPEYSWVESPAGRVAWCCPKDEVHRFAPWVLEAHGDAAHCAWSNEVFVVEGNFAWSRAADEASLRHWASWSRRVKRYRRGVPSRPASFRSLASARLRNSPRVLIVGASAMGNVGDDLLAQALSEMVHRHCGAAVSACGPDVDPLHLRAFDVVLVGPGGLVYERRGNVDESQNLVNYLKFGPICRHLGLPVAMIGVGDQQAGPDPEEGSWTARFIRRSLAAFDFATTRDSESAELLRRWGAQDVSSGCDLVFEWAERARKVVRPQAPQPSRIAIGGELALGTGLAQWLAERPAGLADELTGQDIDLLVMSEDDLPHVEPIERELQRAGVTTSRVDLRGKSFDLLIYLIASYDAIVTTRFHAVVLAALSGVPVLALASPGGKIQRLVSELGALSAAVPASDASAAMRARVLDALNGRAEPLPMDAVRRVAEASQVHRQALHRLWPPAAAPAAPPAAAPGESPPAVAPARPAFRMDLIRRRERFGVGVGDSIGLCWAASTPETAGFANMGDSLSAVMVCALAGRRVQHVSFEADAAKLVAVGSIAHAISRGEAVIWGSGVSIRGGTLAQNAPLTSYDVRAVRGEISARHLRDFGIHVPDVFGDPVWMLPSVFDETIEKRYELGVIPHIQDIDGTAPDAPARADSARCVIDAAEAESVVLINTWHEPTWEGLKAKLRLMLSCKRIISQSFHGVVIAEAFGIPVLHFRQYRGARRNGLVKVDMAQPCRTDPRIWEFYKGGARGTYPMYAQRRHERTDWGYAIRMIDMAWQPFEYDAQPLVNAFPLPLAYDPLSGRAAAEALLQGIRF